MGVIVSKNSSRDQKTQSKSGGQFTETKNNNNRNYGAGIQDEARSFHSKISAIKLLTRGENSYHSFLSFLQQQHIAEYLICFRDIEEIRCLSEDQIISRTSALIWRYKTIYETYRILGIKNYKYDDTPTSETATQVAVKDSAKLSNIFAAIVNETYEGDPYELTRNFDAPTQMEYLVWECLGKLRHLDFTTITVGLLQKHLLLTQNELLTRLISPFEEYLQSHEYKQWKITQIEFERNNKMSPKSIGPYKPRIVSTSLANTPEQAKFFHRILVVDDSIITLKLAGKTLQRDGHQVEMASNGRIALEFMKNQTYDVVLIDCNMPEMDGFEAVQFFREYERNKSRELDELCDENASEVSSISDVTAVPKPQPTVPANDGKKDNSSLFEGYRLLGGSGAKKTAVVDTNTSDNMTPPKVIIAQKPMKTVREETEDMIISTTADMKPSSSTKDKQTKDDKDDKDHSKEDMKLEHTESHSMTIPPESTKAIAMDSSIDLAADEDNPLQTTANLKRLKHFDNYHQLIIGMSASLDREFEKRALAAGMDYFMSKPFTLEKFIDIIESSQELFQHNYHHHHHHNDDNNNIQQHGSIIQEENNSLMAQSVLTVPLH